MRSSIPLYVVGAIILVAIIALAGKKLSSGVYAGRVVDIVGAPEVRAAGQSSWRPVKLGDPVGPDASLRSPAGAEVDIAWPDNTHVRLAESSTVTIEDLKVNNTSKARTYTLRLEAGKVWARLRKASSDGVTFAVWLDKTKFQSYSGTFFIRVLPGGGFELQCLDGSVQVVRDKKHVGTASQRKVVLAPAGKKSEPGTMDREQLAEWVAKRVVSGAFLVVDQPKDGEPASEVLTVSGRSDPGNSVHVNGVSVPVKEDGSWSYRASLQKGQDVVVVGRDEEGRETTIVRKPAR